MSDGEVFRPRRAWQPDEDEVDLPDVDDTADAPAGPARRGSDVEAEEDLDDVGTEGDASEDGAAPEAGTEFDDDPGHEVPWEPDETISTLNPFARPGSEAADAPIPSETIIPAPVFPRSAGEFADSPSPAPRRSALSSTTPVETGDSPAEPAAGGNWVGAHRRTLATWAAAGLVLALIVGLLSFFIARSTQPAVEPSGSGSPSPSASPSSASPSPTTAPIEADSLLLPLDLAAIAPTEAWAITDTTTARSEHSGRGACLSTEDVEVNPVTSLQRLLATSDEDQLAALHQIDVYATEEAATEVFDARAAALAGCDEVPALIVRSSTVAGLADDARQLTIAFENEPTQYHTVLITRVGASLQLVDFARNDDPVDPEAMAGVLSRPQEALCTFEGADCPGEVAVDDAPVPAADPVGWLIPADIPRVRPGIGRWAAQGPVDTISAAMGCENMDLATEAGPSSRQQSTYLMTQDPEAPATFGMDEIMFTFEDANDAAGFVTRLGNNLATCDDRLLNADVTEHDAVPAVGRDGMRLSSRIFTIDQATGEDAKVTYQLIVSAAGPRITYTLITVDADYRFSEAQLAGLAARIPVRASQLS